MSHSLRNFGYFYIFLPLRKCKALLRSFILCLPTDEGDDFLGIEGEELIFSRDTRTLCFNVTILNDGNCEDLEFFSLSLSSSQQRVLVTPSTGYVIISDPPLCSGFALI